MTEPHVPPASAVEPAQLDSRLAALIAESQSLRSDLKSSETQRRKENLISVCTGLLAILFIGIVLAVAVQNRSIAEDAKTSANSAKKTSDAIADCITPTGHCYQDGSKRTGGAVGNLIKAQLVITDCNRHFPVDDKAFNACVVAGLKRAFPTTPAPAPTPAPPAKTA